MSVSDNDTIAGTALVVTPDEVETIAIAICGSGWKYCPERYRQQCRDDALRALAGLRNAGFVVIPPVLGRVNEREKPMGVV